MHIDRNNEMDEHASLPEQATDWWVLLNEGSASRDEQRAFAEWIARSPDRVGAYLQTVQLAQGLNARSVPWPQIPVDALLRQTASNVSQLGVQGLHACSSTISRRAIPMAWAALVAALVFATVLAFLPRGQGYQTALGEQRSVVLKDGSLVTLNTASRIHVNFSRGKRHIVLLSGEALFHVVHDSSRPFVVEAAGATIRDIGTEFNVDSHAGALKVAVIEGSVEVGTASGLVPVHAGQQVALAPGASPALTQANIATVTGWTRRELIFEARPLGEIALEFNRYNRQVIDIQSRRLYDEKITGVFRTNDPQSFLRFIAGMPGVRVEPSADQSRYIVREGEP